MPNWHLKIEGGLRSQSVTLKGGRFDITNCDRGLFKAALAYLSERVYTFSDRYRGNKYMQSIDDKIVSRIYGKRRGFVFSPTHFLDLGSRDAVDQALSRAVKRGLVRRVMRGVYDYPRYSDFLDQWLSPDLHQIAQVLAQKFGWRIQPSGDTALNFLGLSTQVPSDLVYLSDGPSRMYKVGKRRIVFRKTALKNASLKLPQSALIVQALIALGKDRITDQALKKIRKQIQPSMRKKILKDAMIVQGWVYELIREICSEGNDG